MPDMLKNLCIFVSKYAIVVRRLNKENVDLKLKMSYILLHIKITRNV